jgi:2-dehydro-3-deoxyphosphogluconate aldolase/(4S)-4-hydroxy-2-oxoglutarate aldolase
MRGPLASVPLIPTGGVTADNAAAFIAAGALGVGVGSWLIADGSPDRIRQRATQLMSAVQSATR